MDNIQLCYIDNEINKIDKMKQGDVIYLKWEDDPISLKSVIEGLLHVDIEFYKQKIINFVKWI